MSETQPEEPVLNYVFYHYEPSLPGAVIMIIVFGLSAIYHVWQLVRTRTWYFIPFVLGCLFEAVGYIGRAMSHFEAPDYTKNPYIIQSILLLLGPALYAASIYMILGRIVVLLEADRYSIIPPRWLTKVFVIGDVLSFFAQGGGGGLLATADSKDKVQTGENVILGGLGIQILFFGFFVVVTYIFHRRIVKKPTSRSYSLVAPWKALLYVLYSTSILILVRSVFRVIEYVTGSDGYIMSNEWFLYVFDAVPMAVVSLLFNWFHPSRVVQSGSAKNADYVTTPSRDAARSTTSLEVLEGAAAGRHSRYGSSTMPSESLMGDRRSRK